MPTSSKSSVKPQFQRVEDKFYWRPPVDGDPVEHVIPLRFKTGFYRRLNAEPDPVNQLAMVLTEVEQPKVLALFDDLDLLDGVKVAEKYFEAFNQYTGATSGE